MSRKLISFVCVLALASTSYGVVIGNWENSNDGWIDWGNKLLVDDPCNMPVKVTGTAGYQYDTSEGITLGSTSLEVTQSGWGQSLSIKLQDAGHIADFLANDTFEIDMSVAATAGITSGYSQINAVSMNAEGAGWQDVASGNPVNFYWWEGRPDETQTLTVDYTAFRDLIDPSPGWIEIIFALNTGDGAPPEMYFDNAQLTPEPTTIALLGLGALALRRRKR